jgi:hypothetical protein
MIGGLTLDQREVGLTKVADSVEDLIGGGGAGRRIPKQLVMAAENRKHVRLCVRLEIDSGCRDT